MASQILTLAKIVGDSADVVSQRFTEWNNLRSADDVDEWRPDNWPASVHAEADRFVDSIREHCYELPIVFYTEFVDMWSFCPPIRFLGHFELFRVYTNRYEVFCLRLPLPTLCNEMLELQSNGQYDEDRIFASHVLNAIRAWQLVVPDDGVLIMIRRVVSGAVEDHEIEASLRHIPSWL